MPNLLTAAWDYLRGNDLKVQPPTAAPGFPPNPHDGVPPGMERKLWYYSDVGAAIRMGTLVHGPGASELLGEAFGNYGRDANSAVFACLAAICTAFPEAPLRAYKTDPAGAEYDLLPQHPVEELFKHPNPYMTGASLWYWVQWAKHATGDAYLRKIRADDEFTGNVVQLWPLSPAVIQPVTTKEDRARGVFISYYKHEYETGKYEYIPPENIVHFKLGIDDYDHRRGCSPLKRLARQIATDDEAEAWTNQLLRNYAIPGMVVTTPDKSMTLEQAEEVKRKIADRFGGENRGQVGVLNNGATVQQFGFSPEQMDMKTLHRVPEERIAAVMRVPAIIAGLGAGLDRSTYANFREAREMFAEMTILPLYTFDAATVNLQLLPDFTSDPRIVTRFDISDLRALQEDEDKKYTRLNVGVQGKWITPNEARADVGLPPVQGGDELMAPPAPTALPAPGPRATVTEVRPGSSAGATGGNSKAQTKAQRIDPERFPELFEAMVDLAAPALEQQLEAYFEGQRRRVLGRLLADVTDPGTADPTTARAALPRV